MNEITIIGAGLSGLMAGWQMAKKGKQVKVVTKGWGAAHWLSGCVDVVGYYPVDGDAPVVSPETAVNQLIADNPQHPYALVGKDGLAAMLAELQALCADAGYPLHGSLERNWLLPTAVGAMRPTCLAPETMTAGDLSQDTPMLLVGFQQLMDFYPNLAADNLSKQGIPATYAMLDLSALQSRQFTNPMVLARLMAQADFRKQVADALKPHLRDVGRVGFPAVLGLGNALAVKADLEQRLQRPVFEMPGLTPSVPGIRLHTILVQAIVAAGGRIENGMEAIGAEKENGRVTAVYTAAAARPHPHRAEKYILATGGILGGGIVTNSYGEVKETVFNLPVTAPAKMLDWFHRDFMDSRGHPIYQAGLTVNEQWQPVNGNAEPVFDNVYAVGTTLAHCEVIRERSFEGVALATGFAAAQKMA